MLVNLLEIIYLKSYFTHKGREDFYCSIFFRTSQMKLNTDTA